MIALLRSTDGNPDSRFEKYVNFLESKGVRYYTICWDRKNKKKESENHFYYKKASTYGKRYGHTKQLIGFNTFIYKKLRQERKNYKVIHACDFDTIIPAILMHIFYGKKVIYDIFDWYVDSRRIHGFIKYLVYIIEFINIKLASVVIVCESERIRQILFKPKKIWILPNIPNFQTQQPVISDNEKLTIAYVGILGALRGIENLVRYAKEHADVNIKIAGFGPLEHLFADVEKYPNIKYYGAVKYTEAIRIMNSADMIMGIYEKANPNHILAAPNKYYESLYLGKPIITTLDTIPGTRTVEDNTGYAIEEKYEDFARLIESVNKSDLLEKAKNARRVWNERYATYVQSFFENTYLPYIENVNFSNKSCNKGYLFISNGTKPTAEQYASLEPVAIGSFSFAAMSAAKELGYKLYCGQNRKYADKVACTNFDVTFYDQHVFRSIFALRDNYKAYRNCCNFLKAHPDIEVIHCNTPIGGVIGRLCGWKFRKKVIYTAHGFHFYKGAPLKNWLLFYTAEKMLARMTDVIITINQEDYELASRRFKLRKGGKVCYVPGVGIDLGQYENATANREEKRRELGLTDGDIALFSMGDLVSRKNYPLAIKAIAAAANNRLHYFICGDGAERENLKRLAAELNITGQIHFLGYRNDVKELLKAADIFLFTTLQEGLPRSLMEAMASGLPCVVSKIRGNTDLITDGKNGYLCSLNDYTEFSERIILLAKDVVLRERLGKQALLSVQALDIEHIKDEMKNIFTDTFQIQ